MTRWLRRLWPEGIAARLGLLLLAGLAVFGVVAGLFYLDERRDRAVEHFGRVLSVRMLAIVELLEKAAPEERRNAADGAVGPAVKHPAAPRFAAGTRMGPARKRG